jgi:hypothetical protein
MIFYERYKKETKRSQKGERQTEKEAFSLLGIRFQKYSSQFAFSSCGGNAHRLCILGAGRILRT